MVDLFSGERDGGGDECLSTTLQCHSLTSGLGFYCFIFLSCHVLWNLRNLSRDSMYPYKSIFTRCVVVDSGNVHVIRRDTHLTRVNALFKKLS